jgi:hypothetical protein
MLLGQRSVRCEQAGEIMGVERVMPVSRTRDCDHLCGHIVIHHAWYSSTSSQVPGGLSTSSARITF